MIHEVDEGLRRLLAESGLETSGVEVVFDAPTRDWAARRSAPTVCVFLYDVREDPTRRGSGSGEVYDAQGLVVARRTPPRWFELTYLVTAWAGRPQDEHRLLSEVLSCLVAHDSVPPRLLGGTLAELGLLVPLDVGGTGADAPAASEVWSALGGELRPSIGLRVLAPLAGVARHAAPPVTEGLALRSGPGLRPPSPGAGTRPEARDAEPGHDAGGSHGAGGNDGGTGGGDEQHRLRYTELAEPAPGEGFGAPRERRPAPARRRRGGRQP
ncbi:DUF4255 domain-containing protein [Streptomyces sp. NPDC053493]|uniref:DUF4255 domain-containing protein n=1 Tax=Streptomyces sp. NPDC053493 TaxID=3365705 RepID=UPI0037D863D9